MEPVHLKAILLPRFQVKICPNGWVSAMTQFNSINKCMISDWQ